MQHEAEDLWLLQRPKVCVEDQIKAGVSGKEDLRRDQRGSGTVCCLSDTDLAGNKSLPLSISAGMGKGKLHIIYIYTHPWRNRINIFISVRFLF